MAAAVWAAMRLASSMAWLIPLAGGGLCSGAAAMDCTCRAVVFHQCHDFLEDLAGFLGHQGAADAFSHPGHVIRVLARAALDAVHGVARLLGGGHGFFGQLAHFGGHYGKAASDFARAGGLNGRMENQRVDLVGYVSDNQLF